jgi:uncharacterized protein (TIGR02246 family)
MIIRTLVASALVCVAGPVLAQTISESDAKQVATQVTQAWATAYNADKPADIAALFTADGVFLTGAGTKLTDHAAITAALDGRIKAGWTDETINVIEARPEGSDVLGIVAYEIKGTGAVAGRQIGGYALQVMTRDGHIKALGASLKPVQDITGMSASSK